MVIIPIAMVWHETIQDLL